MLTFITGQRLASSCFRREANVNSHRKGWQLTPLLVLTYTNFSTHSMVQYVVIELSSFFYFFV